jgi:ADP-ribose pyrophosphatase
MGFKVLNHRVVYKGRVFNTVVDEIEYDSGSKSVREVAEHPGGAVVLPLLEDGRVVFVYQYRYPLNRSFYELPAGKLDEGEEPEACARRELQEETGYSPTELKRLTSICTSPGFCSEVLHIFLACGLRPGKQRLEEGELDLRLKYIPMKEALHMVMTNEIVDGKTIAGLFFVSQMAPFRNTLLSL